MAATIKFSKAYQPANGKLAETAIEYFNQHIDKPFEAFSLAKKFVEEIKPKQSSIKDYNLGFSPINVGHVLIDDKQVSSENYSTYGNFINFISYIKKIVLDKYDSEHMGLAKMDNPPLEVYRKVGHNKLGIKESAKAQSSLYEN